MRSSYSASRRPTTRRPPARAARPAPGERSMRAWLPGAAALALLLGVVSSAGGCSGADAAPADTPGPALFAPFGEPLPGSDADARALFDRGRLVALRRFYP